jgi:pyruvate/2-oxoglutarate dehydrogenase complex dihydrolipoamide acyltransferase (E2) component
MAIGTAGIVAISTSLASAGASAAQASKASGFAKQAKKDSELAFNRAMNELTSNKFKGLNIPTEAYERERDAMASAAAQATEAGRESERGTAATAGRVQMAAQEGQRQIAGAMGEDLMKLEGLTAQEEARLSSQRANLELAQAEGAQTAAAQFGAQSDAALTGAFSSLASAGQQYLQASELYKETEGTKELQRLNKEYDKAVKGGTLGDRFKQDGKALPFNQALMRMEGYDKDLSKIAGMTDFEQKSYLADRPELIKELQNLGFGSNTQYAPPVAAQQGFRIGASNLAPNNLRNIQLNTGFQSPFYPGF